MIELVKFVVVNLVDMPENVNVIQEGDIIKITVDPSDMGKIIGRQGRIAKAIRSIVRAASIKRNLKVSVEIVE